MTIKERIAELREIEAAATPIPFEVCKYNPRIVEVKGQCRAAGNLADCQNANDAAFIATARNTYPALLDALSEAVEALEFYAAGGSLNASTHDCGAIYIWEGGGTDRPGAQARAALESIEERLWR